MQSEEWGAGSREQGAGSGERGAGSGAISDLRLSPDVGGPIAGAGGANESGRTWPSTRSGSEASDVANGSTWAGTTCKLTGQ
jgi:hypothetical protein